MSADDWLSNYGYTTDYQAQANLVHLWHATGEDHEPGSSNPLYYGDDKPDLKWTDESVSNPGIDNMDTIYLRITAQNPDAVDAAGTSWYIFALNMWDLVTAIGNNTDKIRDGGGGFTAWKSDAANAFYMKGPGATIKSLRDWQTAAYTNSTAMHDLAGIIRRYRQQIETLHQAYKADLNKFEAWWNKNMAGGDWNTKTLNLEPEEVRNLYVDRVKMIREGNWTLDIHAQEAAQMAGLSMRNYSAEAKVIQQNMANEYAGPIGTLYSEGRSTRDQGPTNAVTIDQKTLSGILAKAFGGAGGNPSFGAPPIPVVTVPPFTAPAVPDPGGSTPNVDVPTADPTVDPSALPATPDVTAPTGDLGAGPAITPGLGMIPGLPLAPGLSNGNGGGKGLTAPAVNPPVAPNALGLNPGTAGGGPTLPGGLLGRGMPGGSPGMPGGMPSAPRRSGDSRNRLNKGVLNNRSGQSAGPDEENMRSGVPGGMPGAGRRGRAPDGHESIRAGGTHLDDFGDGQPGAPTSPPVLGRPQTRRSDRQQDAPNRLSPDVFANPVYTPPGTTAPILGAPQQPGEFSDGGPGPRGTAPGTPPGAGRGTGRTDPGSTAYPPLPGDPQWLTQPPADAPPVAAPVLDASARPTDAERAGGAWNDKLPTTASRPGATAPVIGRAQVPGQAGTGSDGTHGRPTESDLRTRHRSATPAPVTATGTPDTEVPPVVGDEQVFTVQTPGGEVLGSERENRGYEAEPKPTLGN